MRTSARALVRTHLVTATAAWLLAVGALGPATATIRDVEVRSGAVADGALSIQPAASLASDVEGPVGWPVRLANGSAADVEVRLSVHLAVPGPDREPTPGAPVDWALLPRDLVHLRPGDLADLTIELSPEASDLPAAVVLLATTVGADARTALATRVLWAPGHTSEVRIDAAVPGDAVASSDGEDLTLLLSDAAGPSVVHARVRSRAWPATPRQLDLGPLVLLDDAPREVGLIAPTSLLGHVTEAVVAIDGVEVARTEVRGPRNPWRLALVGLAATAIVALAVAGLRARHRHT